jgi:Helix-turn-helix domain
VFEIGSSLREARQRKGIDLRVAEHAVKVRAKYLRALEDEQFDVLPAATYVKGFLRAYADYLGLDGELYVDEYTSRFVSEEGVDWRRARRVRTRKQPYLRVERNIVLVALAGIAVLTALIIAAWKFGGGGGTPTIPNLPQVKPSAPATHHHHARANLVVEAVRGSSLLQVRVGSASGRPLYQGTLERGQSEHFVARRLWLNVGSPENLWMRLNGRPVQVGGTCPRVFVIAAHKLSSTALCG